MAKKVLVTGAPGWLGTRFVEKMIKNRKKVRCLVLKGMDYSYLDQLGVETIEGDVTRPATLKKITKDVDTVFHIAGIVHTKMFRINDFFRINTQGTRNMLDASINSGVRRFVYISSNSPAGFNYHKDILMNEYTPVNPYMKYGKSKVLAEKIVNEAFIDGKIETVILRPCWYYGPRQPERQTKLIKMVRDGKALLLGDGSNLRSMTYIDNLCDALMLAEGTRKASGETYWIADERPYTMMEIYNTIAKILGVELKVKKMPGIFSDIAKIMDGALQTLNIYQKEIHVAGELNGNIACTIEKAKKDLGYKPKISLEKGMRISINWAKENGML